MKKILTLLSCGILLGLVGCSTNTSTSVEEDDNSNQNENGNNNPSDENPGGNTGAQERGESMVVYFSATGNIREVANLIAEHIDAPIHELVPVDSYTSEDLNYSDPNSRLSQERNDPNHLTELVEVNFEEFDDSDYIFVGAPVWWGNLNWVIDDFLLSNDFSGKTIIPFATASLSSFSNGPLEQLVPNARISEGRRFRHNEINESSVNEWLDSYNVAF